jgi:peroxiredoxin
LPPGKYYLTASAKGYQTLTTNSFELSKSTPISTVLSLKKANILSWLSLSSTKVNIDVNSAKPKSAPAQNKLINQSVPSFSLNDVDGKSVSSANLLGRPTVISFNATWSPMTSEQLPAFRKLQQNQDINAVLVGLQENAGKIAAYNAIASYQLNWLADPNSRLTNLFDVQSLPTNYFIDRKGVVKQVITGVLSEQQISSELSRL